MKKILALALPLLLATWSAQATVAWYEGFNYANGNITNVSSGVWTNFSGSNLHDMLVNNGHLEVSTTGNAVTSRADDDNRTFSIVPGSPLTNTVQVMYAAFTVICTNLPNGPGSYYASFYNPAKGFSGRILAFTNGTVLPNTWRMATAGNSASTAPAGGGYPVDLALNTPYQVVEEIDPVNLLGVTIWINPVNPNETGIAPIETHYTSSDSLGYATVNPVNSYAFRQASTFGNGFWVISNLVVATSFAEAWTNLAPTNAIAPVIVLQPVGNTNFVGASLTLSTLANGQGLGNMTYQWYQGTTPYSGGSGATTPILTIGSAQTTDSGNFTLVATTPYGLSVTSSVAKVLISAAPVPPSFVTQPVSQTVYVSQNVFLTTTVTSPGTVSYQWQSNGIPIVGANNATLELDNVQTNFSASYRVAVTNNVVANGIISTNAVLTVQAPAVVSIAYLRSLVDPVTLLVTNVPASIPYQVTGVITTATNLTSGNTAGYFLQDATAGINIFVTLGSTFRPLSGDVVTFVGVLSSFTASTGGLELDGDQTTYPFTSWVDTGVTNALPAARVIPFDVTNVYGMAYVVTNIEGSRVTLQNVYFGTNSGVTISATANQAVTVTNAAGQSFNLQFYDLNLNTVGITLPTFAYSVTGVLLGSPPTFSVAVTFPSDINTTPPPTPIPLGFTATGGTLGFTWSDPTFVLQSSTNVLGPYSTIIGAASGFSTNVVSTNSAMFFRLSHP